MARKVRYVFVPYLLVSIPAIGIYVFHLKDAAAHWVSTSIPADILYFICSGTHLGPLWFVPMIMLIYLASPVFIWIDRRNLYALALPILALGCFWGRPPLNDDPFRAAIYFMPAYLLGMFVSRHRQAFDRAFGGMPAILASAAVFAAGSLAISVYGQDHAGWDGDSLVLANKFALVVLLYGACVRWHARMPAQLSRIGRFGFPIFLLHGYLVGAIRALYDPREFGGLPLWQVVLFAAATVSVVGVCYKSAQLMRSLLGSRSRLVIGV